MLANMDQMDKSDKVVDEAKEGLKKVPKRTGPAGLLIVFLYYRSDCRVARYRVAPVGPVRCSSNQGRELG